ncbi:polysaccharide pyruvyl transferase family protein [Geobacillus stearothermophilus]|nr:polysaccharide pyruvyl transferase family protein [Geobacillus stearothermophilus]
MKKVLYIGWLGFHNVGDELLWNLFAAYARQYAPDVQIIPSTPKVNWKDTTPYDAVVLGGGSLLLPGYMAVLHQAHEAGKRIWIWGSGIDWIGPNATAALLAGAKPALGSHFSANDADLFRNVLAAAAFAGIRGPLSEAVLKTLGAYPANVRVIGDPGLLLSPAQAEPPNKKEKTIGINWGTTYNHLFGQHETLVEDTLARAAKTWIANGYRIYLYTVWPNDRPACERLYRKINCPERVTLDRAQYNEQQLLHLLRPFTATVNFKLHANVLSLAAGVPAVMLGYRFKVFDFAASIGLERCVISTASPQLERDLLETIAFAEDQQRRIIAQYEAARRRYVPLLLEPFERGLFL